jgi:hypothetical protein
MPSAFAASSIDATCSVTFEATAKLLRTPHRSVIYVTQPDSLEAPIIQEMIFLRDKNYWRPRWGLETLDQE